MIIHEQPRVGIENRGRWGYRHHQPIPIIQIDVNPIRSNFSRMNDKMVNDTELTQFQNFIPFVFETDIGGP